MITEFTAKVLDFVEKNGDIFLILDKTAFYPKGGGQDYDKGYFLFNDKKIEVLEVYKVGNSILHKAKIDEKTLKELLGKEIKGFVDKKRRKILTQQHDAVHLLNGVCQEILGKHVWQSGSNVTEEKASLDITHFKKITETEIEKIEEKLNEYIFERIPINKFILERTEAEKKFGFRIYQGGVVPSSHIRIVEIENIDVEACGGTHGDNTLEIQNAFLLDVGKIQDNVYRFELVAGINAYLRYKKLKYLLDESCKIFNVKKEDLPKVSKRFFDEWKEQRKEIEKLSNYIIENMASILENNKEKIIDLPLDNKIIINLAKKYKRVFKNDNIVAANKDLKEEILKLTKNIKESKDLVIGFLSK